MWRQWQVTPPPPPEQREAICNDFQTSPVQPVEILKIHVADEHVGSHSGTSFPADSGHHALDRETAPTQHPCRCTSCTVVAKNVEVDGHTCKCVVTNLSVGQLVKGPPEGLLVSATELVRALSSTASLSTFIETSRCHP